MLELTASQSRRCRCRFTAQESLAICEYLCARFPGAAASKLLPPPGRARAEVQQWVSVEATELRPHALKPCAPPHPAPPHRTPPHTPPHSTPLHLTPPHPTAPHRIPPYPTNRLACLSADPPRAPRSCADTQRVLKPLKGLGAPDEGIVEEGRRGATPALDVLDAHLAASGLSWLAGADFTLADLGFVPYLQALCDAGCEDLLEARPSLYAWFGRCRARPTWQAVVAMSAR